MRGNIAASRSIPITFAPRAASIAASRLIPHPTSTTRRPDAGPRALSEVIDQDCRAEKSVTIGALVSLLRAQHQQGGCVDQTMGGCVMPEAMQCKGFEDQVLIEPTRSAAVLRFPNTIAATTAGNCRHHRNQLVEQDGRQLRRLSRPRGMELGGRVY
jgi:hypothetical protein